jgi:hypothetical protein
MSLSETFDHGVPIPWANMRFNNVDIDGTTTNSRIFQIQGTASFSDTATHTIYSYTLPTTNNGTFSFIYKLLAKGGPSGSTANAFYQRTYSLVQITSGVTSSALNYTNSFAIIGFPGNSIGENTTVVGNVVNFTAANMNAGQTTNYAWQITVYSINPSI